VPLAIHNNKPGDDKVILERYDEPAWNNPVVRFFAPDGDELLPRKDLVWDAEPLAARMIAALDAADRPVPGYLRLVHEELREDGLAQAVFSMACFWKGEAAYGAQPGVRSTRAAWLDGREVVEVTYDPERLPFQDLLAAGLEGSCADQVWVADAAQQAQAQELLDSTVAVAVRDGDDVASDAKPSDQKFYLQRSAMNHLPLTPLQATRANALLAPDGAPAAKQALMDILSPHQRTLLQRIETMLNDKPSALDGLERPAAVPDLAGYEADLERRLNSSR